MKKYIVRPGDTMWSISKATGVKVNLLLAANPQIQDPNRLRPGDVIVIPELGKGKSVSTHAAGGVPGHAVPAPAHEAGAGYEPSPYLGFVWPHVVQEGETWQSVAARYGVPVERVQALNPTYQGRPLHPGEIVYVPLQGSPLNADATGMTEPSIPPGPPDAGVEPMVPEPATPVPPPWEEPAAPFEPPAFGPHSHYPYRVAATWGPVPAWRRVAAPVGHGHYWMYGPHHVPYPAPYIAYPYGMAGARYVWWDDSPCSPSPDLNWESSAHVSWEPDSDASWTAHLQHHAHFGSARDCSERVRATPDIEGPDAAPNDGSVTKDWLEERGANENSASDPDRG
jgi:LysM repeat protein